MERILQQSSAEEVAAAQVRTATDVTTKEYIESFIAPVRQTPTMTSPARGALARGISFSFASRTSSTADGHSVSMNMSAHSKEKIINFNINSWDFDALTPTMEELTSNMVTIFKYFNLFTHFKFQEENLVYFLAELNAKYLDNPYHNMRHAVDICHVCYRILTLSSLHLVLPRLEVFALLVASLGHDVGHLGVTNPFLVRTRHELAMRYNDVSPLENMHCSLLFEILSKEECNLFVGLSASDWVEARKVIIATIMATDMLKHYGLVSRAQVIFVSESHFIFV